MKKYQKVPETIDVIMGRQDGVVSVPGDNNAVYVRESQDSLPFVVRNFRITPQAGLPVKVGEDPLMPGVQQVLTVSYYAATNLGTTIAYTPAHATTHLLDGSDPVFVTDTQILPLLTYATSGFGIAINPGWITVGGKPVKVSYTTLNLANYVPVVVSAKYVLIRSDASGSVSIQEGPIAPTLSDLSIADYAPSCEAGYVPLAFVRLYYGQTALSKVTDSPDVVPVVFGGGLDSNTERQVMATVSDTISVATGKLRFPNHFGRTLTIDVIYLDINTAPTGAAVIVDVNIDGTTIFTTQANRPQIAASAYAGSSSDIDVTAWEDGSYLTIDVDQVGSTLPGSDLTVTVVCHG